MPRTHPVNEAGPSAVNAGPANSHALTRGPAGRMTDDLNLTHPPIPAPDTSAGPDLDSGGADPGRFPSPAGRPGGPVRVLSPVRRRCGGRGDGTARVGRPGGRGPAVGSAAPVTAAPPERPSPALRGRRAPHWRDRALCALPLFDADDWFPPRGPDPGRKAKAVCAACPVAAECLGYALEHGIREGIWGGLSEGDRRHRQRLARLREERRAALCKAPGRQPAAAGLTSPA